MDARQELKNSNRKSSIAKIGTVLFLSLVVVYVITASGRIDSGDGLTIFAVSQSLFEDRDVTIVPLDPDLIAFDAQGRPLGKAEDLGIEDGYSIKGRDGRFYSHYGIGHSLLLLPFLVLGRLAALTTLFGPPQWTVQFVTSVLFNPLASATSGLLIYHAGRRLSFSPNTSFALAIAYAFGTMTWVYAKSFFSEPLVALFLLFAFYNLLSYRCEQREAWLWIGGASLGVAVLVKPASLIYIPILAAYLIFVTRAEPMPIFWRRLIALGVPLTVGVVGMMGYNWLRFGSPIDTGYRNVGWTFPFLRGLYGLIASPGKGYLLYNPISLGAIIGSYFFWRQHKPELLVIVSIVMVSLVFLAKYDHWNGGGYWGPRLLLPITPFVILPLGSLIEKIPQKSYLSALLSVLIALSIIVQIPGVSVNYARFLQKVYDQSVDRYYQRVTFEVAYSPLIGHWGEMREVVGNLRDPAKRAAVRQVAFEGDKDELDVRTMEMLSINLPDFWFVYLIFFHNSS